MASCRASLVCCDVRDASCAAPGQVVRRPETELTMNVSPFANADRALRDARTQDAYLCSSQKRVSVTVAGGTAAQRSHHARWVEAVQVTRQSAIRDSRVRRRGEKVVAGTHKIHRHRRSEPPSAWAASGSSMSAICTAIRSVVSSPVSRVNVRMCASVRRVLRKMASLSALCNYIKSEWRGGTLVRCG